LERETAEDAENRGACNRYFFFFGRKTRSEDGTVEGDRIRVVMYFFVKRPALELKKEVDEIGVMVKNAVTKGPYYV
jgi:hypothetical protein